MKEYILNLTEEAFEKLCRHYNRNWDVDILKEYGSKENFAEEFEYDPCWLDAKEEGYTPEEYCRL